MTITTDNNNISKITITSHQNMSTIRNNNKPEHIKTNNIRPEWFIIAIYFDVLDLTIYVVNCMLKFVSMRWLLGLWLWVDG